MAERRYSDPCGIARALDRVGERWALLVVRELLLGPKRFGDLVRALQGISANVLTQRLKELEAAGVVHRRTLLPPANIPVYELTAWGRDLEPVLLALASWGSHAPLPASTTMSADAFVLSLRTTYQPPSRTRTPITVNLALGVDQYALTVGGPTMTIKRGHHDHADIELTSDVETTRAAIYARTDLKTEIATRRLVFDGNAANRRRFLRCFKVPSLHPDARNR
jgi:DNA-binding HxlR family transcriptional regulator